MITMAHFRRKILPILTKNAFHLGSEKANFDKIGKICSLHVPLGNQLDNSLKFGCSDKAVVARYYYTDREYDTMRSHHSNSEGANYGAGLHIG